MKQLELKIEQLVEGIEQISYSHPEDAGLDLRASGRGDIGLGTKKKKTVDSSSYIIKPDERILVRTGIRIAIPIGYFGSIHNRSGMAFTHGLHVMAGVVDSNYRGEIGVLLINLGQNQYEILKGDRIAQMIIIPYAHVDVQYVPALDETDRGSKGFGSTGNQ